MVVGCCIDKCLKLCLLCVVLCALVTCLGSYRCTVFCVVLRQPVSGLVGVLWAALVTCFVEWLCLHINYLFAV